MTNLFTKLAETAAPKENTGETGFFLATVATVDSTGITFIPDGQTAATQKKYKMVDGSVPAPGSRVVVMKHSGTCLVLGIVGNPGDTLRATGHFNLDSSYEIGVSPAQNVAGSMIRFRDKNGNNAASLADVFMANGDVGLELVASRPGYTSNFIRMTLDASGNGGVYLSHPTAWLNALGTVSYTETASEICTAYSSEFTVTAAKYAQWGKLASLYIQGDALAAHTNEYANLFTMAAGKRPKLSTAARAWRNTNAILYDNGNMEYYGTWAANQSFTFICTYLLA